MTDTCRVHGQGETGERTLDCRCFNSWRSKLPSKVITPAGCCHLVCCASRSKASREEEGAHGNNQVTGTHVETHWQGKGLLMAA